MTTFFKQEQLEPSSAYQSGCNDSFDVDSFINYDPTGSISPASSRPTPILSSSSGNTLIPVQPNPQFAGPSHRYDEYKQQAGFPLGALQNTYAVNQADQYRYGRQGHGPIPPTEGLFGGTNTSDDYVDFNTPPSQTSGDIDMDFVYSTNMNTLNSSYIDPATIGGQETTPRSQLAQVQPVRAYPGMHTQQAAQAKAQAEAQQQATIQQQQQRQSHSRQTSRSGSIAKPSDCFMDESISRLLNQMRHSSVASSHDDGEDDATTPNANGHSYRSRKDEEDMDEDEKLLASEEGKKLSSKERRQLRNKVSARAFRSRRKEYIGQLEGEINDKTRECEDLQRKNEHLKAENTRLTDLTQMLLSSPHFRPFLEELGHNEAAASTPLPSQGSRLQSQVPVPPSQGSNRPKDVNPNQVTPRQSQSNMHVGLTMIPEEPTFDYAARASINTGYNNMDFGPFYTGSQVYAVTTVPQGPAVDRPNFGTLSGKSSNFVGPSPSSDDDGKDEPTAVDVIPMPVAMSNTPAPIETSSEDATIAVSDAALALFSGSQPPSFSTSSVVAPEECIFGGIELEKAFGRIELSVDMSSDETAEAEISSTVLERFERLCARCDVLSSRVKARTSHLL